METFSFIDIYATKGIEYLIVIGFLVSLVFFHKYFVAERREAVTQRQSWLKPYLGEMRWNPVMAYMKHPEPEKKSEEGKKPEEKKKS